MSVVVVGKGGTLGVLLAERLGAPAIEIRSPDPRDVGPIDELRKARVVVNAGGPRVRKGLSSADYFREHVGVTTRVARSMRPGAHLVHIGSTAVFGARAALLASGDPVAPTLFPSAAYASAKLAAELAARAEAHVRGLALTILRPSMVYGPGVDSALESIRRLAARGITLQLRPLRLRQHLTHVDLVALAVERAAALAPSLAPARIFLVADPFVLRNEDIIPPVTRHGLVVPVPLDRLAVAHTLATRVGLGRATDAFRVLAMDNEFDVASTFTELGIDRDRFARDRTFDPYWSRPG